MVIIKFKKPESALHQSIEKIVIYSPRLWHKLNHQVEYDQQIIVDKRASCFTPV